MGRQQISGAKLAEMLGWSQQVTSRRLRGEAPLTVAELEKIADALQVHVSQLVLERAS